MITVASTHFKPKQKTGFRYSIALWALLFLFCLRVLGQVLVVSFSPPFLPPMHKWMSGIMPYPALLASQLLIIFLFGKTCLDVSRRRGCMNKPRPRLTNFLTGFGRLYILSMIARYAIYMTLHPEQRWLGGCIPIIFHIVLATFILTYAKFQKCQNR